GLVWLDVLHDDGVPRLSRDLRGHLDDLPVLDEGPAGQILAAGLPGHRDDRVVLALRRSGVDHPVHDRLPDLRSSMETTHKLPNYMLIWLYLFILTGAEVLFAFEMPISQLVVLTAAAGFYLGAQGRVDVRVLIETLIGVALVAAGTNAFNQLRERDVDARMQRTRGRPLPSGRLTPRAAAVFAAVISIVGV